MYSTNLNVQKHPPGLVRRTRVLHHVGRELHHGADDTKRMLLLTIAENTYIFMMFYFQFYFKQTALLQKLSLLKEVISDIPHNGLVLLLCLCTLDMVKLLCPKKTAMSNDGDIVKLLCLYAHIGISFH